MYLIEREWRHQSISFFLPYTIPPPQERMVVFYIIYLYNMICAGNRVMDEVESAALYSGGGKSKKGRYPWYVCLYHTEDDANQAQMRPLLFI